MIDKVHLAFLFDNASQVSFRITWQIETVFFITFNAGITFNTGANWQAQRRFSMKVLRDFGFGKMSMITSIQDEIKELQGFLR